MEDQEFKEKFNAAVQERVGKQIEMIQTEARRIMDAYLAEDQKQSDIDFIKQELATIKSAVWFLTDLMEAHIKEGRKADGNTQAE